MAVLVEAVPESITREDYLRLLRSVGIDPADLRELVFGGRSIEAVIIAKDADGKRYLDGGELAVHRIRIPVVDGEPPDNYDDGSGRLLPYNLRES